MKIKVERDPPLKAQLCHSIEPGSHELGVAGRIDSVAVLCEERAFRDPIQSGLKGRTFVHHVAHHVAHHVTVAPTAKEL